MKKLLFTLLVLFSLSVNASSNQWPEVEEFSKWLATEDFINLLNSVPNNKYPVAIQGSALLGDGVVFRVLLIPKSNQSFQHKFTFGKSKEAFTKLSKEYEKSGFTLIQSQTVLIMSGLSYQGVWAKND